MQLPQTPMTRRIRPASLSDAPAIAALLTDLGYPGTDAFLSRRMTELLHHPDAELLVAVDSATVCGVMALHFIPQLALDGDFCRITYFCVAPDARGAGIGAALERHATELARQRGCDRMEVHCHARRNAAHRFYARQGYTESPKYLIKDLNLLTSA